MKVKQGERTIKDWTKDVVLAMGKELNMVAYNTQTKPIDTLLPEDSQSQGIYRELSKLTKQVKQWKQQPDEKYRDESGMWYGTDKNGQVNEDFKSNFLEVLRLVDKKVDDMHWYERLFVMWQQLLSEQGGGHWAPKGPRDHRGSLEILACSKTAKMETS